MTWNADNPAMGNQVAADIPDIEENFQHLYDTLTNIGTGWSNTDATQYVVNTGLSAYGLILSLDTDTDHDINVTAGSIHDSTRAYQIVLSSEITKKIDASWAHTTDGDDEGGFPTEGVSGLSLTADTWYHVFLVGKSTDSTVVGVGFDENVDASVLLNADNAGSDGFDIYARIGSVLTDGSSNITSFSHIVIGGRDKFLWDVWVADATAADQDATAILRTLTVPPDVQVEVFAYIQGGDDSAGGPYYILFTSPDQADTVPSSSYYTFYGSGNFTGTFEQFVMVTNTSSQIRTRSSTTDSAITIKTYGWYDPRRQ